MLKTITVLNAFYDCRYDTSCANFVNLLISTESLVNFGSSERRLQNWQNVVDTLVSR